MYRNLRSIRDICVRIKNSEGLLDKEKIYDDSFQEYLVNTFCKFKSSSQNYFILEVDDSRESTIFVSRLSGSNAPLPDLCRSFTLEEISRLLIEIRYMPRPNYLARKIQSIVESLYISTNVIREEDHKHLHANTFRYEICKLCNQKGYMYSFKPVREVLSKMKYKTFARNNLSEKCNRSFGTKFFSAICKFPNNSQLFEIYSKYPPKYIFRLEDIPKDYPPAALGMCLISGRLNGKLDVSEHHKNFKWAPKSEKTKFKRTNICKPARIQLHPKQSQRKHRSKNRHAFLKEIIKDDDDYRNIKSLV